jgi:ATP-dependent Clp protease adapter protein ClpS
MTAMRVLTRSRESSVPQARSAQPVTLPRTEEEVRELLLSLPRYRVLLYNDDHNDMEYVVLALLRTVAPLSEDEAIRIMLQAHLFGIAQVIVCLKEPAEHYREGLEQRGLTSTIELV